MVHGSCGLRAERDCASCHSPLPIDVAFAQTPIGDPDDDDWEDEDDEEEGEEDDEDDPMQLMGRSSTRAQWAGIGPV